MKKPARLVAYVRVSTEEQAREGLSLTAQRRRLAAYASAHGARLVRVEEDAGVSGSVPPVRRPGLARAIAAVRRGEADGIAAVRLDRLSRRTRDVLDLAEEAQRAGWRLVSIEEHLDSGTAMGRFALTLFAGLAQLEREQNGERVRAAMGTIQGRARSGRTPFGWRTAGGDVVALRGDRADLVKDPAEQLVLGQLLGLHARGLGPRRIARALGRHPRTCRPWTPSTVAKVIATALRRRGEGAETESRSAGGP